MNLIKRNQVKRHTVLTLSAVFLLGTFAQAEAPKSPVTVTTASYQLVVKKVKDKKGKIKKIKKWVKATKVVPGTVVRYVDTIHNSSADPLSTVAIKNPINEHLTYMADSAKAESNATITYSVDGGKHFATPSKLFVTDKKGKKHRAQPKQYNAIQWVIAEVPAKGTVKVEFKAKLK